MTYGCHNRRPFQSRVMVQDGWWTDGAARTGKMKQVPFRMSEECQYTKTELGRDDERCAGCKWKQPQ